MLLQLAVTSCFASKLRLEWHAPFFSGSGMGHEAISYIQSLHAVAPEPQLRLETHMLGPNDTHFINNILTTHEEALLARLSHNARTAKEFTEKHKRVIVCHSVPNAWVDFRQVFGGGSYPELSAGAAKKNNLGGGNVFADGQCPPADVREGDYVIGRAMSETTGVLPTWLPFLHRMDEIWVPTKFNEDSFTKALDESANETQKARLTRVKVIPEPLDVEFLDPSKAESALDNVKAQYKGLLLRREQSDKTATDLLKSHLPDIAPTTTLLLSVFSWDEERKGADVLVKAFAQEFSAADNVVLCILSNRPVDLLEGAVHRILHGSEKGEKKKKKKKKIKLGLSSGSGSKKKKKKKAAAGAKRKAGPSAPILILEPGVSSEQLRGLYRAATAFVLPSRGEGWGRCAVEAMVMGLPVIATNFSGPTAYMTPTNSFPLNYSLRSPGSEWSTMSGSEQNWTSDVAGLWAEPSAVHLRQLMRQVAEQPEEARDRGAQARQDVLSKFSYGTVGSLLMDRLNQITSEDSAAFSGQHDDL